MSLLTCYRKLHFPKPAALGMMPMHRLTTIRDRTKEISYDPTMKPHGLWYGVDGDWDRWVTGEDMHWTDDDMHLYEVHLGEANVLKLDTEESVRLFHSKYVSTASYVDRIPVRGTDYDRSIVAGMRNRDIHWGRVAEDYDGIEIAPYRYELRMEHSFFWYYGWDAATGCIWRPHETTHVTVIREGINPRFDKTFTGTLDCGAEWSDEYGWKHSYVKLSEAMETIKNFAHAQSSD